MMVSPSYLTMKFVLVKHLENVMKLTSRSLG